MLSKTDPIRNIIIFSFSCVKQNTTTLLRGYNHKNLDNYYECEPPKLLKNVLFKSLN